jgi:hypothetical protein
LLSLGTTVTSIISRGGVGCDGGDVGTLHGGAIGEDSQTFLEGGELLK